VFRPDAHGGEDGDGFGGFGQAAQEVKAFSLQGYVRQDSFLGQCGEGQKAVAGADEAGQQGCGGQGVSAGLATAKARGMVA
jgi:hypothetical protein